MVPEKEQRHFWEGGKGGGTSRRCFFFLEKSSLPAFRLEEVGKEEDGMVEAGCRKGPAFK